MDAELVGMGGGVHAEAPQQTFSPNLGQLLITPFSYLQMLLHGTVLVSFPVVVKVQSLPFERTWTVYLGSLQVNF